MAKTQDKYLATDPWKIVEEGFHPDRSRVSESLFSLGNEYQGVRGYFEEGYSGDTLRGCYLNGIWEEHLLDEPQAYKGISRRICFIVNTVDWLHTRLEIDGEALDLNRSRFSGFRRELDFRTGILRRELVWQTRSGKELLLSFTRLLGMGTRELGLQRVSATPLNFSGALSLTMGMDFSLIHESRGESFWECPRKGGGQDTCAILGVSRNTRRALFAGFRIFSGPGAALHSVEGDRNVGFRITLDLNKDNEQSVDKACILFATDGPDQGEDETWAGGMELIASVDRTTFEDTGDDNGKRWQAIWDSSDIVIHGDPDAQQGIRFCIFQLQQTCRGIIDGAHIGAKGLTGEAYNGNAFWDTEIYCLPYYLFSNPSAARALIDFRARTLPQALERARELDCEGACFPVATIDGKESCTLWQHASLQFQPTTAVAYAIRHYSTVTGDIEFLFGTGVELLIHICRFLASRGQWSPRSGGFGFYGVMGPDEFHMMVNNNFYTNFMAKQTLLFTLKVLAEMGISRPERKDALLIALGCTDDEQRAWGKRAESMIIPYDPRTGIYEQHEGFFDLPHIDVDSIPPGEFPLYAHWSYDRIFRTDMIKQPDVLMLMLLHNASFTATQKKANYDYYRPRCIHESSLSPSVHSILASELGRRADAFEFFRFATRIDLDNYNRNTAEGLHMTSLAAAWMNIVYGFGGMRSDGKALTLNPSIPEQWKAYRFQIAYRGSLIRVDVSHEQARVRLLEGPPVSLVIRGKARQITAEGFALAMEAACNVVT
jgi:maltose phosphorylase